MMNAKYDSRYAMMQVALLLLALPSVRADRVCATSDSGTTVCQDKLTPGTIVALTVTVILLVGLLSGGAYLVYRRRKYAAAKAAVAANAYVIDAAQMRGPAPFTTYAPAYDPHSAPAKPGIARKPSSAKGAPQTAPTTYGGVTYPFPGFSSPKGTPPRSQPASAFSGTYTTLSGGIGSAGKPAPV
ncbi:hypothetical protein FB451DRAFT_1303048 [Mycena latifolia]|nr:hypothetical protein FB451DRAFT_1303048 [Mycena latifolia]